MKLTLFRLIPLFVPIMLAGCRIGTSPGSFDPAQNPEGVTTRLVTTTEKNIRGELIAVRENGLVVLSGDELLFAPFDVIRQGRFSQRRSLKINDGNAPGAEEFIQIRMLSRFPQGLSEALLTRLLEAYGQDELITVR